MNVASAASVGVRPTKGISGGWNPIRFSLLLIVAITDDMDKILRSAVYSVDRVTRFR